MYTMQRSLISIIPATRTRLSIPSDAAERFYYSRITKILQLSTASASEQQAPAIDDVGAESLQSIATRL